MEYFYAYFCKTENEIQTETFSTTTRNKKEWTQWEKGRRKDQPITARPRSRPNFKEVKPIGKNSKAVLKKREGQAVGRRPEKVGLLTI